MHHKTPWEEYIGLAISLIGWGFFVLGLIGLFAAIWLKVL